MVVAGLRGAATMLDGRFDEAAVAAVHSQLCVPDLRRRQTLDLARHSVPPLFRAP
jgi:hypothetical protein